MQICHSAFTEGSKVMKNKIIALLIAGIMILSVCPVISFAEDTLNVSDYGLKSNPLVLTKDNQTIEYEAEAYPLEQSNYRIQTDETASGGAGLTLGQAIGTNSSKTGASLIQYRLYLTSEERVNAKVWMRFKISSLSGNVAYSRGEDTTLYQSLSPAVNDKVGVWGWYNLDSIPVSEGQITSINIMFRSFGTIVDKIVITSDPFYVPRGMGESTGPFYLGKDTTDYENLSYPLPPFKPVSTRPRVFVNSERLETIKKNFSHPENKKVYEEMLKEIEKPLTEKQMAETQNAAVYIEGNAFMYLLTKNKEYARKAVDSMITLSKLYASGSTEIGSLRESGYIMKLLAEVYDWCYDALTDSDKLNLISYMLDNASSLENGYPVITAHGRLNGHVSEGDIFVALMSCGIAIYEDYPEMYHIAAGKYYEEMLSTRNFYYEKGVHTQGKDYDTARMTYEAMNLLLMHYGVRPGLMDSDSVKLLYDQLYITRPDNYSLKTGDSYNVPTMKVTENEPVFFYLGNYYEDPYIRDRYFKINAGFATGLPNITRVTFLLHNNPDVGRKSEKELPLTRFYGEDEGVMVARTGWNKGIGDYTNDMLVRFFAPTIHGAGHDHLDKGHFDIYYKGSLALDSGVYNGEQFYDDNGNLVTNVKMGSDHDNNYHRMTIAHNAMLIYNPAEAPRKSAKVYDGGQIYVDPTGGTMDKLREQSVYTKVLAADYGEDMYSPSYSYMKSDLTKAYADITVENFTRSFVFFNFFDEKYPGAVVVFDNVTSKNPDFKKTWLLHTEQEPTIDGKRQIADKTEWGDNGRLINDTLLPEINNASITKVGGKGNEYSVHGVNYKAVTPLIRKDFGEWRIEVSPKTPAKNDHFLNVMHVTDASGNIEPLEVEYIDADNFAGAKIKDRVVFFSKEGDRTTKNLSFELDSEGEFEILVTDIRAGKWKIYKDGNFVKEIDASINGGCINFKGTKGSYKIVCNLRSVSEFVKDLNFLNYVKPYENAKYMNFNGYYHEVSDIIEEGDKLFLPVKEISKLALVEYEITNSVITFKSIAHKKSLSLDSENIRMVNGEYFVNPFCDDLSTIFLLKWSVAWDNIYILSGGNSSADIYNDKEEGHAIVADITGDEKSLSSATPPILTVDGVDTTQWSTDISGSWVLYTFDKEYDLYSVDMLWSVVRGHNFKVETSVDGVNFTEVFNGWTKGEGFVKGKYQNVEVTPSKAKYVRVTGFGNDSARPQWFNYCEIRFNTVKGDK